MPVTKKEQDGEHPASHYLVVEDREKPSTWHLRVKDVDGSISRRLMGAAWAALHGGYRGNKYQGPNKQEAISKLKKLYEREGMDTPGGKSMGNALKTIDRSEDELRVGNYLALFGGRDLEGIATPHKNEDGSVGQYFTPETEFESSYTKTGMIYVDWEHGMGQRFDGPDAPTRDDVLGYVDWKSAKKDDVGLWAERVLDRRNKYMEYLEVLIEAGLIGSSTEATKNTKFSEDGQIEKWPVCRDTLTVQPAEPRMMTENVVSALKNLADEFPQFAKFLPVTDEVVESDEDGDIQENIVTEEVTTHGEEKMSEKEKEVKQVEEEVVETKSISLTEDELKDLIDGAVSSGVEKALEAIPEPVNDVKVIKDESEQPFETDGDFFIAVKNAALYRSMNPVVPMAPVLAGSGATGWQKLERSRLVNQHSVRWN
jgi:hypothetical protein